MRIFVSYAREDKRWLDPDYRFSLIPYLQESLRRYDVAFWFDKVLIGGEEFKPRIETEIDRAQIALLIVTQHFLNSEFIETFEMPRIGQRAERGQMVVVPVLVEPCAWNDYPFLADRQMVPSASPLIHYIESESKWADVRFQILDGLKLQVKRIREAMQAEVLRKEAEERDRRERELDDQRRKQEAVRMAEDEAIRKQREERERIAAKDEALRKEAEDRRQRELALQRQTLEAERKAQADADRKIREQTERKAKEAAEQNAKEEAARKAQEEAARKARQDEERKVREEQQRKLREQKHQLKPEPGLILWNPRLLVSIGVLVAIVLLLGISYRLIFGRAGAKWVVSKSGIVTDSLYFITGSADGRILYSCGSGTPFLNSTDGGATWVNQGTGAASNCDSIVSSPDGKQIWAPASSQQMLASSTGGATWQKSTLPNAPESLMDLLSTPLFDDQGRLNNSSGSSSSSSGIQLVAPGIYQSHGLVASKPVIRSIQMKGIFAAADGRRLWAAGDSGDIYESDDGGATWAYKSNPTSSSLLAISGTSDASVLIAIGQKGAIVQSNDTGSTWHTQTSGTASDLHGIFVAENAKIVCVVGDKGVILTSTDKGSTWSLVPSSVLWNLHGVFGTASGKHLWVVGDGGVILESNDNGATWAQRTSGVRYILNSIYGTGNGKHLWAVGNNGTIIESKNQIF